MTPTLRLSVAIRLQRETRLKRYLDEPPISTVTSRHLLLCPLQVGVLVSNLYAASAGSAEGAAPTFKKRNVRHAPLPHTPCLSPPLSSFSVPKTYRTQQQCAQDVGYRHRKRMKQGRDCTSKCALRDSRQLQAIGWSANVACFIEERAECHSYS